MNKLLLKRSIFSISVVIMVFSFLIFPIQVHANNENTISNNTIATNTEENEIIGDLGDGLKSRSDASENIVYEIMNKTFYIKNAFSGQYLDVDDGNASDGANVIQYPFNGGKNQQWNIQYNNDGTFTLYSQLGNNLVLDIDGGKDEDLANVHIWSYNGSDAQKFKLFYTSTSTYEISAKSSNYKKAVVTHGYGCSKGDNVNQYTYSKHWNELWILEPVAKNNIMGVKYAKDNFNSYVYAYPNLSNFGGDCTNFVSQCMLASGRHIDNSAWGIYRKNRNNTEISNVNQLNDSWALTDPSPWISAKQFKKYWSDRVSTYTLKGSEILKDPSKAWNLPIVQGCVIQKADNFLGIQGDATHSMYITGYENNSYLLTDHTTNTLNKNLLDFCNIHPDAYYIFYVF